MKNYDNGEITKQELNNIITDKYKYLQEENAWIEIMPDYVCINWNTFMDNYCNYNRIRQIAKQIRKYTKLPIFNAFGLMNI